MTLTPKNYLRCKGSKVDMVDIIFLVIIIFNGSVYCPTVLKEFINLSKDILYYKATKQRKSERVNILFYIVYVIIFNDINDFEIEYDRYVEEHNEEINEKASLSTDKTDKHIDKCKYLYVYTEYDEGLMLQMKFEQERMKLQRTYRPLVKGIDIDWSVNNERDFVTVRKV